MNHWHRHVIPSHEGSELYGQGIIWTFDRFHELTNDEAAVALSALTPR